VLRGGTEDFGVEVRGFVKGREVFLRNKENIFLKEFKG